MTEPLWWMDRLEAMAQQHITEHTGACAVQSSDVLALIAEIKRLRTENEQLRDTLHANAVASTWNARPDAAPTGGEASEPSDGGEK